MPAKGFRYGADELRRRTIARLWERTDKSAGPNGCWLWTGPTLPAGYGYIALNYRNEYVHRLSYEEAYGPIPAGKQIDHVKARGCRHRNCVNPAHLEAVTIRTNQLRSDSFSGINGRKTHCIRDHEFNVENTHVTRQGRRHCRPCERIRRIEREARLRAA